MPTSQLFSYYNYMQLQKAALKFNINTVTVD